MAKRQFDKSIQEQVQEMKQILIDWAISNDLCFSFDVMQKHAEVLIKNGYRKVLPNSIILTQCSIDYIEN